ncbi:MAG: acetate--CoA ligase family protein [Phycisphaerales bacterium]|nr:MAG: acetate--CoA ligase family protein [Phycisphaerales bacterium]
MARLHEHQGKAILSKAGLRVPRGRVARTADEARAAATELGVEKAGVMVKVQAWTTGRAAAGGIKKATTAADAADHASRMLTMSFGRFPVTEVLIEECISIARELFVSIAIDEAARAPVILLSATGGSGVEERADATSRVSCHVVKGPNPDELKAAVARLNLQIDVAHDVQRTIVRLFEIARSNDARSLEINPLAITPAGETIAADCRITIDDYAVARHPELGIEIARELDHPPTALERVAYTIEQQDHRGTFFFAQMNSQANGEAAQGSKGLIGFHGAGGGGSMMSMDAITAEGFTIANFCDTSGNPSPAKVYRAARVILSQPGLVGYFGSGSGVANQEQFWSAYGLAKAFWELELSIPAVVRLGGNTEDRAVEILHTSTKDLPAKVEGYKKTDTPKAIASRFATLVEEHVKKNGARAAWTPREPRRPAFVGSTHAVSFEIKSGGGGGGSGGGGSRVWIDLHAWKTNARAIIARSNGLLKDDHGRPAMAVPAAEFASKDSDLIAAEVECRRDGVEGLFVVLDMPASL